MSPSLDRPERMKLVFQAGIKKMEDRRKQVGEREKEENEQTSANAIN